MKEMTERRGVQYFTLSEIEPRIWFMLTGCNFRCRGCFRPARDGGGVLLTAEEALSLAEKACEKCYGFLPKKAMITGGEPTISRDFLLSLISGLRERGFEEIVLMTNGYAIGEDASGSYAHALKSAGLTEVHIDIKAFSDEIHRWYTGKSNKPVLSAVKMLYDEGIELLAQTIYIPGIVQADEIERIASFLASIDENIKYRINPFAPTFAFERVSRAPTIEEMERAYEAAKKHLKNVIVSRSCFREFPTPPPQRTWLTVYPDLTVKRRSMKDQNEERLQWLRRPKSRVLADFERELAWDFKLRERILSAGNSAVATGEAKKGEGASGGDHTVKVKFSSALLPLTKKRELVLKLSDGVGASSAPADAAEGGAKARSSATLREVLRRLAEIYGEAFKKRVFDGSSVNEFVNISLNGRLIDDLDEEVRGGDEIIILSVISGG